MVFLILSIRGLKIRNFQVKKLAEKGAKRAESRGKLREQYDTITSPSPVTSPGAMGDVALVANQVQRFEAPAELLYSESPTV